MFYYLNGDITVDFFRNLGVDVVMSSKTNKRIVESGMKYAPDEMCLSMKNYIGHVSCLVDKCDYLLIPRIDNYYTFNQTCTNFLAARDIIDFTVIGHLIVPALLVIIGLFLIFKKEDKDFVISKEYEKDKEIEVTFSDQTITVDEEFSSRKASAVFGKLTLDLTKAKIKKDTNIKLEAVFGSVNLILPEGLDVKIKSTPIFGGISNNYNNTGSKTIYIEADAVFGGVTIK